jgi:putative RNA 2'-phosphotransferase
VRPPEFLFHGTAASALPSIREAGLQSRSRQHVHLSPDRQTAIKVGRRHGKPVVLQVHSGAMNRAGHPFYLSQNGVWLVDQVPPEFLEEEDPSRTEEAEQ